MSLEHEAEEVIYCLQNEIPECTDRGVMDLIVRCDDAGRKDLGDAVAEAAIYAGLLTEEQLGG